MDCKGKIRTFNRLSLKNVGSFMRFSTVSVKCWLHGYRLVLGIGCVIINRAKKKRANGRTNV